MRVETGIHRPADPRLCDIPRGPARRVLADLLRLAGRRCRLIRQDEEPWFSATFTGFRMTATLAFEGPTAIERGENLIAVLADHEFTVPNHLVADAAVSGARHSQLPWPRLEVDVDLLVLEEA